ncbi:mRNA-decapping enzyme 1B [Halotydeus destructor]|nr:mRNA-decapping enzyme 1B [Halotydeus destructor]
MSESSENEINLRTLRRGDPSVETIIASASQVAIYKFHAPDWQKLDIEGSLFIFSRYKDQLERGKSRFGFTVINRLSTTNLSEDIRLDLDLSYEAPYILYKNARKDIFCIWFYSTDECFNMHSTLVRLGKQGNHQNAQAGHKEENGGGETDVMAMLTNAFHKAKERQESKNVTSPQRLDVRALLDGSVLAPAASTIPSGQNLTPQNGSRTVQMVSRTPKVGTPITKVVNNVSTPANNIKRNNQVAKSDSANGRPNGQMNRRNNNGHSSPPNTVDTTTASHLNNRSTPVHSLASAFNGALTPNGQKCQQTAANRPLSMEELKRTMIHLLKNDADFLHTIHSAYVDGFGK